MSGGDGKDQIEVGGFAKVLQKFCKNKKGDPLGSPFKCPETGAFVW